MLFHNDPCPYEANLLEETEAPYKQSIKQGYYTLAFCITERHLELMFSSLDSGSSSLGSNLD